MNNSKLVQDIERAVHAWINEDKIHRTAVVRLFHDKSDDETFGVTAIDGGNRKKLTNEIRNLLISGRCLIGRIHQAILNNIDKLNS